MELSQLRAVLALKEAGGISKAAELLHLTPPAVLHQVRRLQDQLGLRLYQRVGRRLELTPAGRLVADHAKRILHACEEAAAELARHGEAGRQILRIGCGPQTSLKFAPYLLQAYLRSQPNTDARLSVGNDHTLLHDLRVGLLDAVLLSLPLDDPELVAEPLWRYEMVFVAPRSTGCGTGEVRLEELAESPFLLFTRPVVTDLAIRELCSVGGIEPNIVIESEDPGFIREAVRLGLGFAVLPYWIVAEEARRGLVRVVRTRERIYHSYGVIWRRHAPPRALSEFVEVARQWGRWWPLARYVVPLEAREERLSYAGARYVRAFGSSGFGR